MGTILVALVADITGREDLGLGALAVMFAIGLVLFIFAVRSKRKALPDGLSYGEALTAEQSAAENAVQDAADAETLSGEGGQGAE